VEILVISIASPLLVGIYKEGICIQKIEKEGKSSDILPLLFEEILKEYSPEKLYYANGPGSYMAIKIAYVFLKTLAISLDIPLQACDAFVFNNNSPIKAIGKNHFLKENSAIIMKIIGDEVQKEPYKLPECLNSELFNADCEPLYIVPAV
jgi:tRNA A37 threonylcarbamoyladenosine modification protein TsaB